MSAFADRAWLGESACDRRRRLGARRDTSGLSPAVISMHGIRMVPRIRAMNGGWRRIGASGMGEWRVGFGRVEQRLNYAVAYASGFEFDDLIGRQVEGMALEPDLLQDDVLTQTGLDKSDDVVDRERSRARARRLLGERVRIRYRPADP